MKHLIILVIATLSLMQNAKAKPTDLSVLLLPNYIEVNDREISSRPHVIYIKRFHYCPYCDPDMERSALKFEDTQTMTALFEMTGFKFKNLTTKIFYNQETDEMLREISNASMSHFGHHRVSWILESPQYRVSRKNSHSYCSIYVPEACEHAKTWTCQLIKSQTVKMLVFHHTSDNSYTEFQDSESKVIREWEIPIDEICKL